RGRSGCACHRASGCARTGRDVPWRRTYPQTRDGGRIAPRPRARRRRSSTGQDRRVRPTRGIERAGGPSAASAVAGGYPPAGPAGRLAASHLQGPIKAVVHSWTTSLLWCAQSTPPAGRGGGAFRRSGPGPEGADDGEVLEERGDDGGGVLVGHVELLVLDGREHGGEDVVVVDDDVGLGPLDVLAGHGGDAGLVEVLEGGPDEGPDLVVGEAGLDGLRQPVADVLDGLVEVEDGGWGLVTEPEGLGAHEGRGDGEHRDGADDEKQPAHVAQPTSIVS